MTYTEQVERFRRIFPEFKIVPYERDTWFLRMETETGVVFVDLSKNYTFRPDWPRVEGQVFKPNGNFEIGMGEGKSDDKIRADYFRRFHPEFVRLYTEQKAKMEEHIRSKNKQLAVLNDLLIPFGQTWQSHMQEGWAAPNQHGIFKIKVDYRGESVDLELWHLTVDEAKQVIDLLQKTHK